MNARILLAGLLLFAGTTLCQAGWLENALQGGMREVVKGGTATAPKQTSGTRQSVQKKADAQEEQGSTTAESVDTPSIEDAETIYTKFDFVPGDQMLFFDDFSDTDVGEFPRKWTLEGPKKGNSNTVEVVEYLGRRFLRSVPGEKGQPPATQYLRLDQQGDFPEKFTIEFDAVLDTIKKGSNYYIVYRAMFVSPDKKIDVFKWHAPNSLQLSGKENSSANTKTTVDLNDGKVHHVAISVNGTFVKAYIDNQRVVNDPDGIKRPIKQLGLQMLTHNNMKSEKVMFTNFRLAKGGKEIKSALETDGKIITHGILFATGKDSIKPESLPTLKMILGLLNDDPELKFSIEGHTDNQGNKGINQPLSERRAAAVKAWLEGKGVEAARLKTAGFGDTKPIDSNKTPEGRANNRRVEFVKF